MDHLVCYLSHGAGNSKSSEQMYKNVVTRLRRAGSEAPVKLRRRQKLLEGLFGVR